MRALLGLVLGARARSYPGERTSYLRGLRGRSPCLVPECLEHWGGL